MDNFNISDLASYRRIIDPDRNTMILLGDVPADFDDVEIVDAVFCEDADDMAFILKWKEGK